MQVIANENYPAHATMDCKIWKGHTYECVGVYRDKLEKVTAVLMNKNNIYFEVKFHSLLQMQAVLTPVV